MKTSNVIISVNPSLRDRWGHFLHYDERLKEALDSKGYQLIILANKNAKREIRRQEGIYCVLEDCEEYFPSKLIKEFNFKLLLKFITGCLRFMKNISLQGTDRGSLTYFMYISSIKYAPAFVLHALFNGFKHRYILNLFQFHYSVGQTNKRSLSSIESYVLNLVRRSLSKLKVRLSTDSHRLNTKLGVDFNILPMFSTTRLTDGDFKKAYNWDINFKSRPKTIVSFPVLSRMGKGFDKACILIRNILLQSDDRFEFIMRSIALKNEETVQQHLRPIENDVTIYEGVLSDELYKELLICADIIFISYRRMEFYSRTSAIMSDAILLNRPIVGPRDTWSGDIIEKNKLGSTFEDGSIKDMYRALCEVHENFEFYKRNLYKFSPSWAAANSAKRCVEFIFERTH
jgi:hypothetical protein